MQIRSYKTFNYCLLLFSFLFFFISCHQVVAGEPGTVKWRFETEGDVSSSPAIGSDGTIYFSANGGNFYALNPDGSLKWQHDGGFKGSPVISDNGTIYAIHYNGLFAFDNHGEASLICQEELRGTPVIKEDDIIYALKQEHYQKLVAIKKDGSIK